MGSKKRVSPFSFRERITHHFSSLNPIKNGSSGSCFVSPPPPTPRTGARIAAAAFCRSTWFSRWSFLVSARLFPRSYSANASPRPVPPSHAFKTAVGICPPR